MIGNLSAAVFTPGAVLGDYESIATVNVTSASVTSVEFTNIPSNYQHLQIRGILTDNANVSRLRMMINSDGTSSNYRSHYLIGDGSTVSAGSEAGNVYGLWVGARTDNIGISVEGFIIDVLDYKNANKNKTVRTLVGFDANGSGEMQFLSGLWMSTSAITTLKFTNDSFPVIQYSHFALYGIKG